MKKLFLPTLFFSFMLSCEPPTNRFSDDNKSKTRDKVEKFDHPNSMPRLIQRNYTGSWHGLKYSVVYMDDLLEETNQSGSYHDFKIKNGGTVPGYISITTVKVIKGQRPFEVVNSLHTNTYGKVLGEVQKEGLSENIGANVVYIFQDKSMSGFAQDAIIMCDDQEAIHVKFQTQGPEEGAMVKDKEAFRTFLGGIKVLREEI